MPESKDKFAQFYRIQYVTTASIAIIVLIMIWAWSEKRQQEKMHERLLSNCVFSCQFKKANEAGDESKALGSDSIKECLGSCRNIYGK